jgi:GntR family transcriptional regulator
VAAHIVQILHLHLNYLYHATETIEAVIINKEMAELLKCNPKVAGYRIQRISQLDSGFVFEYTTSITRADKCMFQLDLYKNGVANKNPVDIQRHISLL